MEWDMRAVLEWVWPLVPRNLAPEDQTPADLDIWARSFDCYDDAAASESTASLLVLCG